MKFSQRNEKAHYDRLGALQEDPRGLQRVRRGGREGQDGHLGPGRGRAADAAPDGDEDAAREGVRPAERAPRPRRVPLGRLTKLAIFCKLL